MVLSEMDRLFDSIRFVGISGVSFHCVRCGSGALCYNHGLQQLLAQRFGVFDRQQEA
jgi:hypothetical protein